MPFLFDKFSTYYLNLERLFILSVALLALAFLSFGMLDSFMPKAVLFIVYSVTLFNIGPIKSRIFGKLTFTASDKAIIEEIRWSGLPLDEQKKLYRERIPRRSWQIPAVIVIVWFFTLKLLITFGGARYLVQFQSIQEISSLIPSSIFLKDGAQRDVYDILQLKIFKIIDIFSLPFVTCAVCVLAMPFWRNPKTFPISPMAIYLEEDLDAFQIFKRSLWAFLAFFVLFFGVVGIGYALIVGGYTGQNSFGKDQFGRTLNAYTWYKACGFSTVYGIVISAFVKIVIDSFYLVTVLFKKF